MTTSQITYRRCRSNDNPFIINSWRRSYRDRNPLIKKCISDAVYNAYQNKRMARILVNGEVLIACATDDPDIILGYAVYDKETIHYIYVKESYRKLSIAKTLIGIILNEA